MDLLGDFGTGAVGVLALELPFLIWLLLRARRREEQGLAADAYRLGLRHR
jgi:hypothetical protein